MWHLFKNAEHQFNFAFIHFNSKFICGTRQGYENRKEAIEILLNMLDSTRDEETQGYGIYFIQDDTDPKKSVILEISNGVKDYVRVTKIKPSKRYAGNKD